MIKVPGAKFVFGSIVSFLTSLGRLFQAHTTLLISKVYYSFTKILAETPTLVFDPTIFADNIYRISKKCWKIINSEFLLCLENICFAYLSASNETFELK